MANFSRPRGLEPYGENRRARYYTSGAVLYPGDAVKMDSTGRLVPVAAGDPIMGVSLGYASAAGKDVLVNDHPEQHYMIVANGSGAGSATDVGNNADILVGSPDTFYRMSRMQLDYSSLATSSKQLTVLALDPATANAYGDKEADRKR